MSTLKFFLLCMLYLGGALGAAGAKIEQGKPWPDVISTAVFWPVGVSAHVGYWAAQELK